MSDFITRRDANGRFAVLEHSAKGSTWKDHKYIKKIGEGADAVYQYARDAIGGKEEKELKQASKNYTITEDNYTKLLNSRGIDYKYDGSDEEYKERWRKYNNLSDNQKNEIQSHFQKLNDAENNLYQAKKNYDKTLLGASKNAIKTGESIVNSVLEKLKKK